MVWRVKFGNRGVRVRGAASDVQSAPAVAGGDDSPMTETQQIGIHILFFKKKKKIFTVQKRKGDRELIVRLSKWTALAARGTSYIFKFHLPIINFSKLLCL